MVAEVVGIEDVDFLEVEFLSFRVIYKHIILNTTFSVRYKSIQKIYHYFILYTRNTYPSTGLNNPGSAGMRRNCEVGSASRL